MGRNRIELSKPVLVGTLANAERENTFTSRGALYEFVGNVLDIPAYVIRSRVLEWELDKILTTPLGQRGRPKGSGNASKADAKATAPKTKTKPEKPANDLWTDIVDAFAEHGIAVEKMADILTLRTNTDKQNEDVTAAWHLIRELYDCPAPKKPTVRNRKPALAE